MVNKFKRLSIGFQAGLLRNMYHGSQVTTKNDLELSWVHTIRPSPLGNEYRVRLQYKLGWPPQFFVLFPKPLSFARNATKLPHVYDQKKQRLCLFYPDDLQWNNTMPLAKTVVWWGYEWLYHYEIWMGTDDEWKGGGIHPFKNQPKIEKQAALPANK